MKLFRRHILTIIALALYWPGIFILTHIPLPEPSYLFFTIRISDKALHFLAYFVLVFLLWFAVNPNTKVSWRKPAAWWILFVIVWYGVFDEWLQGYVGRSPAVGDFIADLVGSVTALILLSILNFWTAALVIVGGIIFIFTNFIHVNPVELLALPVSVFYLFSYILFSTLWMRWMYHFAPVRIPEQRWLIGALGMPLGFLILTELFSLIVTGDFSVISAVFPAVGIVLAVLAVYVTARHRQKFAKESSSAQM